MQLDQIESKFIENLTYRLSGRIYKDPHLDHFRRQHGQDRPRLLCGVTCRGLPA